MDTPDRIQVVISSRCDDSIRKAAGGSVRLTDLRQRAKAALEGEKLFDRPDDQAFRCWIHEKE